MNIGIVQWMDPLKNPKKSGRLLKTKFSNTCDIFNLFPAAEASFFFTVADNITCHTPAESRNMGQQFRACCIQVHTHFVHARSEERRVGKECTCQWETADHKLEEQ